MLSNILRQLKDNLNGLLELIKNGLKDAWNKYKAILIGAGALILLIKLKDVIIDLLISGAKKTFQDAQKKDSELQAKEQEANTKANELVKKANEESKSKEPVGVDWYKKS